MSLFFKHSHKKIFWSQLLLGIVAILVLPEIQAFSLKEINESEQKSIINQSSIQYSQSTTNLEQQSLFIIALNHILIEYKPQAVNFYELFANYNRLDKHTIYPIRAGPIV